MGLGRPPLLHLAATYYCKVPGSERQEEDLEDVVAKSAALALEDRHTTGTDVGLSTESGLLHSCGQTLAGKLGTDTNGAIGLRPREPHTSEQSSGAERGGSSSSSALHHPAVSPPRSKRQTPSTQSGGVPDPTPQYLARSLVQPTTLSCARPILVVIDLNGTLVHRPSKHQPTRLVERPHARRFLQYCLDTFYVAIWSSAHARNVLGIVIQLLTPEQRAKCVVVWGRDRFGLSAADYRRRVICYKRLSLLWADGHVQRSHPTAAQGDQWGQSDTVLIDDSHEKARSEPHNIVRVPEFSGPENEASDVLPQVHDYLNSLSLQADVSSFIRRTPFTLRPDNRNGTLSQEG